MKWVDITNLHVSSNEQSYFIYILDIKLISLKNIKIHETP